MVSEFSEFFCYDGSVSEGSAYKDWSEYDVLKHFSINLVTLKGNNHRRLSATIRNL